MSLAERPNSFHEIWGTLSDGAKGMVAVFKINGGKSMNPKDIAGILTMSGHSEFESYVNELNGRGLLETTTLIEEFRNELSQLPQPPDITTIKLSEITDEHRRYWELEDNIKSYEATQGKKKNPNAHMDNPRYRLAHDFYADFPEF